MMVRQRRIGVIATFALAVGLAAPLVPGSPSAQRAHAAVSRATGGILRFSDEGLSDLRSIDPPAPEAGDAQANPVENLVFGGLVRLDQNLHVQPNAAKSWTVSNDGKVYTFTLQPGLKWGDGVPVTAADVVWSLTRAFSPAYSAGAVSFYLGHILGGPAYTAGKAKTIPGLKAIGANKVQITLDQPAAVFLDELAYSVAYLVPRHLVEKYGKSWTEHAVGVGPFIVKQWKHNQEIDLAPNPYYWRGKPKLNEVIFEFIKNTETAYNLYQTGQVDVMGLVDFPNNHLADVKGKPDLHTAPHLYTEFLVLNEHKAPFNNKLVRQAFSYAINRQTIANLLNNQFLPASGILPPGMPGYNTHLHGQTFDPAMAKQLLAKAGYANGKGLPKITLNVDGGDNEGQTKATALASFWKQVLGVDVSLNQLEHGAYNNALTARNFQVAFIQWGADYPDPQDFLSLLLSSTTPDNNGYYSSAAFDSLTSQADVMSHDSPARYKKYQQAEQIALNDAAVIVLDWGKSYLLINPKVHGLVLNSLGLTAPNWATVTVG